MTDAPTDTAASTTTAETIAELQETERRAKDEIAALEAGLLAGTRPDADRRAPAVVDSQTSVGANDIDGLLATQPEGSHFEFSDGRYNFYRGVGRVSHGQGKTAARAVLTVNASWQKRPGTEQMVLVSETGDELPPE